MASAVAAFEAFIGLLAFALASGLFYGRFSRPRAYLYFSEKALISPYKDGKALMFRTVPYKTSQLTDAEVKLTLAIRKKHGDEIKNEFYPISVEFSKINALIMNWTIVHPITEDSPMYGQSLKELKDANAQILVLL
jgi:inward rectifier potassium channel